MKKKYIIYAIILVASAVAFYFGYNDGADDKNKTLTEVEVTE